MVGDEFFHQRVNLRVGGGEATALLGREYHTLNLFHLSRRTAHAEPLRVMLYVVHAPLLYLQIGAAAEPFGIVLASFLNFGGRLGELVFQRQFRVARAARCGRAVDRHKHGQFATDGLDTALQTAFHCDCTVLHTDYLLGKTDKFIAPGREGITGLTFSNAIHLAGWTGKEVRLPLDEEQFIAELEKRKEEEKASSKK